MYVDQSQKDLIANTTDKDGKQIKDIHAMDYNEAYAITGSKHGTIGIRNTGVCYWLASVDVLNYYDYVCYVDYSGGSIGSVSDRCWGVRPVVTMTSGVYIKSGTGTDADPYILGKD